MADSVGCVLLRVLGGGTEREGVQIKHLGDICKINGAEIEPVDVIVGGSPCQDLSVAGKRAGLAGQRSGLFMEQIRIVKEMRENDKLSGRTGQLIRPRYMVWENVPGAFSSNNSEDFQAVLEEIAKIADPTISIPRPPKKWTNAGCIMGDGWSIAWRTHDAQFWGVPQRRRRISVVADFGGQSAPEILFKSDSLSRNIAESRTQREEAAGGIGKGFEGAIGWYQNGNGECFIGDRAKTIQTNSNASGRGMQMVITAAGFKYGNSAQARSIGYQEERSPTLSGASGGNEVPVICLQGNGIDRADTSKQNGQGWTEDVCYTLNTIDRPAAVYEDAAKCYDIGEARLRNPQEYNELSPTLSARCGTGGNNVPAVVYDARSNGNGDIAPTMTGDHQNRVTDYTAIAVGTFQNTGQGWWNESEVAATVRTPCGGDSVKANLAVTYQKVTGPLMANSHPGSYTGQDAYTDMLIAAVDCQNGTENPNINGTLQAKEQGQNLNSNNVVRTGYIVRRLTPLECERLQGYPDNYTDIGEYIDSNGKKKQSSDSARYKALGNSIALPFWYWLLRRISAQYDRPATLGSLFDGIGGFPLVWERINGKGTAIWASEIEPFPIAVTKVHFAQEAGAQ